MLPQTVPFQVEEIQTSPLPERSHIRETRGIVNQMSKNWDPCTDSQRCHLEEGEEVDCGEAMPLAPSCARQMGSV